MTRNRQQTYRLIRARAKHTAAAWSLAAMIASPAFAEDVRVGRYTTISPVPTAEQANLLVAIIQIHLPESIVTVGQAIESLLEPSGYRVSVVGTPERAALFALPLPQVHRELGPMSLQTALETLAGPAFRLIEDPVNRLVSFERCDLGSSEPTKTSIAGAR